MCIQTDPRYFSFAFFNARGVKHQFLACFSLPPNRLLDIPRIARNEHTHTVEKRLVTHHELLAEHAVVVRVGHEVVAHVER